MSVINVETVVLMITQPMNKAFCQSILTTRKKPNSECYLYLIFLKINIFHFRCYGLRTTDYC